MDDKIRENLREIISREWSQDDDTKSVWEWINAGVYTAAPAFKGKLYEEAKIKLMYVGHAVNGWGELDATACNSLENTLDAIIMQEDGLETIVQKDKYFYTRSDGRLAAYNHINSNFFRFIKQILEFLDESDSPTNESTWYEDSKNWNEKIVWSNLYCVAPRDGGNPSDSFIKGQMEQYTSIIEAQIRMYKPDVVIFVPLSGYFTPWKREKSFDEILDNYDDTCKMDDVIIAKGQISDSKVIVCRRPDARGKSRDDVLEMARFVSQYIKDIV